MLSVRDDFNDPMLGVYVWKQAKSEKVLLQMVVAQCVRFCHLTYCSNNNENLDVNVLASG